MDANSEGLSTGGCWSVCIQLGSRIPARVSCDTWRDFSRQFLPATGNLDGARVDQESRQPQTARRDRHLHQIHRFVISLCVLSFAHLHSAKTFEHEWLAEMLAAVEPLFSDTDRYKQRAGAEVLSGLLRGAFCARCAVMQLMVLQDPSIGRSNMS